MTELPPNSSALSDAVRERMLAALPAHDAHPELDRFVRLQRDYPSRIGKTLRGRVALLSAAAHGSQDLGAALSVAAALELFQAWVLVHDDIEDGSEQRRGGPTLHRSVGMPIALNVGDAMHVHMWRLLHTLVPGREADWSAVEVARSVLEEFGEMVTRTAAGQHLDLSYVEDGRFDVGEDDYLEMVVLKTAWYTVASPLRLGALLAGREPHPALTTAGLDLGAAFQIRDDVLNLTSPEVSGGYGKEALGDLYEAKRTLMLVHVLNEAPAGDAQEAVRRLSRPRDQRTEEDVAWVLALMHAHGSIQHAQDLAKTVTESGLAALDEALGDAPDRLAASRLRAELAEVAQRAT